MTCDTARHRFFSLRKPAILSRAEKASLEVDRRKPTLHDRLYCASCLARSLHAREVSFGKILGSDEPSEWTVFSWQRNVVDGGLLT